MAWLKRLAMIATREPSGHTRFPSTTFMRDLSFAAPTRGASGTTPIDVSGIVSVTSRPKPLMPAILRGLFVRSFSLRAPRSNSTCAPRPNSRSGCSDAGAGSGSTFGIGDVPSERVRLLESGERWLRAGRYTTMPLPSASMRGMASRRLRPPSRRVDAKRSPTSEPECIRQSVGVSAGCRPSRGRGTAGRRCPTRRRSSPTRCRSRRARASSRRRDARAVPSGGDTG